MSDDRVSVKIANVLDHAMAAQCDTYAVRIKTLEHELIKAHETWSKDLNELSKCQRELTEAYEALRVVEQFLPWPWSQKFAEVLGKAREAKP